ncbi:MAG TPA: cob(I)yrinic acid a,c-diamide adenosyltransferase [Steroidobacteraceae bacterium]|nr:cob(I)yrinic acid a,c-diamide adenosyltransferase [Steroidobacteraceae bacterium]
MGNRLSRIVTRTGDDGTTGLGDGQRVDKDALRIDALGSVDELNCALGVLLADDALPPAMAALLSECQHELFDLGGELAVPGMIVVGAVHVARLEDAVEQYNAGLPPLKEFVLPGGGSSAAACHLARAICRRAERRAWALARHESVNPQALHYLNRLSDLLFVCARVLARSAVGHEVLWRHERRGATPEQDAD